VYVSKVERTNYQNIPQTHILPQNVQTLNGEDKKRKEKESIKKKTRKNCLE
jgi:hypothetical protein